MRYRLGPSQQYTPAKLLAAADAASVAAVAASGKPDPESTAIKDIVGDHLILTVPAQDAAVTNTIATVRAYYIPSGEQPPATADDFVSSTLQFVEADVSSLVGGGEIDIALPDVDSPGNLQVVEGFEV